MSEDQFTKSFKYLEQWFNKVDKQFEEEHREHADIRGAIVQLSAQVRDYHHETILLTRQID